jgi:Ni/Co efflux regulator RcnB
MKKVLLLLLLAVFVLTSTLTLDAAVVNSGSRTAHLGSRAQTVHISVHPRKHRKHKKHKKHHKRKKHRGKRHQKKNK